MHTKHRPDNTNHTSIKTMILPHRKTSLQTPIDICYYITNLLMPRCRYLVSSIPRRSLDFSLQYGSDTMSFFVKIVVSEVISHVLRADQSVNEGGHSTHLIFQSFE